MRKIIAYFFVCLLSFTLIGCDLLGSTTTQLSVQSVEVLPSSLEDSYELSEFQLETILLIVTYSDTTIANIAVTESMVGTSDLEKLTVIGEHQIDIFYKNYKISVNINIIDTQNNEDLVTRLTAIYDMGVESGAILVETTYEEWLETVRGPQGESAKDVVIQIADGFIQWQYVGDTTWTNLIELVALVGPAGADGLEVTFQVANGYIQWQHIGDTTWTDLIDITTLIGLSGEDGIDGAAGEDGKEVTFQIYDGYIQWQYIGGLTWTNIIELVSLVGPAGTDGLDGESGKDVAFQVADGYIQWQYLGDELWQNLVEIATLVGPVGTNGIDGLDGKEITLQINNEYIQWQYVGGLTWTNLIEISTLIGETGADGANGVDGIAGEDGTDGLEVTFQIDSGYIQWQYVGGLTWTNLIELSTLIGPTGETGTDGLEVRFQVADGFIQWQYIGDETWNDLIQLTTLIGPTGLSGEDGEDGTDGLEVTFQIDNGYIQWQYIGGLTWANLIELSTLIGPTGEAGTDGLEVRFQVADGFIQWQYIGDETWNDLVQLATLIGPSGLSGTDGEDGLEVDFQINAGYIQWQYVGAVTWTNLVDLTTLIGATGESGIDGLDGKEVLLQVNNGYIQWQYIGDLSWTNLIELSVLTGIDGVGISTTEINQFGEMIITYTDSREVNIGKICVCYLVLFKDYSGYVIDSQLLTYGEDAVAPSNPTREGYTFVDWNITFSNITANLVVTAQYEINTFNISFVSNGGTEPSAINDIDFGSTIVLPTSAQEGYDFLGWYYSDSVNSKQFTEIDVITENITLYAQWETHLYLVVFEDNLGSIIKKQYIYFESSATAPLAPSIEGYTFISWSGELDNVSQDLTLTPNYQINNYEIIFETNSDISMENVIVIYNQEIPLLEDPEKEGYDFLGWYADGEYSIEFCIEIMPSNDIIVYAKWEIQIYHVEFVDKEGLILKSVDVEYRSSIIPPEDLIIDWYIFDGWSEDYTSIKSDLVIEPIYIVNHAPIIYGVTNVILSVGDTFDSIYGVIAYDDVDGNITNEIVVTGPIDLNTPGDYNLTYTVTNSDDVEFSVTRLVQVSGVTLLAPSGFYNYQFATHELRLTFMAAAETYLMNNMAAGIPLFATGGFVLYSPRLSLPVDSYIPVMGYGTSFGSMTADDSSVLMDNGEFGNAGEYTYRTTISINPSTFNQWVYHNYNENDLMSVYMDALYTYHFNAEKSSYDLVPSMAASNPTPVGSTITDTGKEVAQTWQISIADGLEWFYHPDTDISGFTVGHEVIDANDFVETFKLALDLQFYGGGNFFDEDTGIQGAQDYVDGNNDWADVGIKLIDDLTFEFTFVNEMSEWNVRYFLSSFVITPINIELYESLQDGDFNSYGTNETTIAYHGPFYVDYYENDKILRCKENPIYHDPDEYFYTGYTFSVIEDSAVIFQEFLAGKLEVVSLPPDEYDTYKDNPGLKQVPSSTTFRMMINGLGTEAEQRAKFPDSTWIPEPILANEDFKMAMFFAIDRQKLTEEVQKTFITNMYYFCDVYVVDAEMGVPYRDTDQGLSVGNGLFPSTNGYNPTAARALYSLALDALVTAGDYTGGTAANPTIISLEYNYFSGSETQVAVYECLKTTFEELFVSTEYYINIELLGFAKDFPSNYYDYMMVGEFDLSIGGISGSVLDAASFLDTYTSDNRSGFTLNWGIDTSQAEIEISYQGFEGDWHYELWSFDAIEKALTGQAYLLNGMEAPEPRAVVDSVTATTFDFHIEEYTNPDFIVNSYSILIYDAGVNDYVPLDNYQDIAVTGAEIVVTDLTSYYYSENANGDVEYKSGDYQIIINFTYTVDTSRPGQTISNWFTINTIFVESATHGLMTNYDPSYLYANLNLELTEGYNSEIVSARVFNVSDDFIEVDQAIVDFTDLSNVQVSNIYINCEYLIEFTFADGNWDAIKFRTLDLENDPMDISTIEDVQDLNPDDRETVQIQGIVYFITENGYYVQDSTGMILVFSWVPETLSLGDEVVVLGILSSYSEQNQMINSYIMDTISTGNDFEQTPIRYYPDETELISGQTYTVTGTIQLITDGYTYIHFYDSDNELFVIYYRSTYNDSWNVLYALEGTEVTINAVYYFTKTDDFIHFVYQEGIEGILTFTEQEKLDTDVECLNIDDLNVYEEQADRLPTTFYGSNTVWEITAGNEYVTIVDGEMVFGSVAEYKAVTIQATISRTGLAPQVKTFIIIITPVKNIAEIKELELGTTVQTKGVVYFLSQIGFYIFDETGTIFVYTDDVPTVELGDEVFFEGKLDTFYEGIQIRNPEIYEIVSIENDYAQTPIVYIPGMTELIAGQTYTVAGTVQINTDDYISIFVYDGENQLFAISYYRSRYNDSWDTLVALDGTDITFNAVYYYTKDEELIYFVYQEGADGISVFTEQDKLNIDVVSLNSRINLDVFEEQSDELPTTYYGSNADWVVTTGNEYVTIVDNTLLFGDVAVDTEVTIQATVTRIDLTPQIITYTITIHSILTIAENQVVATETVVYAKGVVYYLSQNGYYIFDETGMIFVYTFETPTVELGDEVIVEGEIGVFGEEVHIRNPEFHETVSTGNDITQAPIIYVPGTTELVCGQTYTVTGTVQIITDTYTNVYIYIGEARIEIYYKSLQDSVDAIKLFDGQQIVINLVYHAKPYGDFMFFYQDTETEITVVPV